MFINLLVLRLLRRLQSTSIQCKSHRFETQAWRWILLEANMRPNKTDIGNFEAVYLGFAARKEIRKNAASGGVVTQIILDLLRLGRVDKAIVSRMIMQSGRLTAEVIATDDEDEIRSAQTSIYFDFELLKPVINMISDGHKYVIVMLPCQARAFSQYCGINGISRDRFIIIGLFCGHATDRILLDLYLRKKGIIESEVSSFKFRMGHWRGKASIMLNDGTEKIYPTMDYNIYQNLLFFTKTRCLSCADHFANFSDISCGDAWLTRLKASLIKHSLIITRNTEADQFIKSLMGKTLNLAETDHKDLLVSQKRAVIFHDYNIAGRKILGKWFGVRINYTGDKTAHWNDLIGAFLILLNYRLSRSKIGQKIIMAIPKPVLYAYAIFIKIFINF